MPASSSQDKGAKQEARYSWWSWRRNRSSRETTPALDVPTTSTETVTKESASITEMKEDGQAESQKLEIQS